MIYKGAHKSSHYIPVSAKMQKDIDGGGGKKSQSPFEIVKQLSKSGITNKRAGQNIC